MIHEFFGQVMTVMTQDKMLLVPFMSIASLLCLAGAIGMTYARKYAHEKKIASALAHAVRARVL